MDAGKKAIIVTELIKNALSKACPMPPHIYYDSDGFKRKGCPNCYLSCGQNEILYAGQKYCSVCGQCIKHTESR